MHTNASEKRRVRNAYRLLLATVYLVLLCYGLVKDGCDFSKKESSLHVGCAFGNPGRQREVRTEAETRPAASFSGREPVYG